MGNIAAIVKLKKARRQFESAISILMAAQKTLKNIDIHDYEREILAVQNELALLVDKTRSFGTNASIVHSKLQSSTNDFKILLESKTRNLQTEILRLGQLIDGLRGIDRSLGKATKNIKHL